MQTEMTGPTTSTNQGQIGPAGGPGIVHHFEPASLVELESHRGGERLVDSLVKASPGPDATFPYDRRAARVLALAAGWSYSHPQTMANVMMEHGFPHVDAIFVSNHAMLVDANAYFLRSECGRVGILCFRGTEPTNIVDWLTDASVKLRPFREVGAIHAGVGLNLACVWPGIAEKVRRAVNGEKPNGGQSHRAQSQGQQAQGEQSYGEPSYGEQSQGEQSQGEQSRGEQSQGEQSRGDRSRGEQELRPLEALFITGHGLGAALAAVAAAVIFGDPDCARWRKLFRGVYTFGQPMVGDAVFAQQCEARFGKMTFRHVHGNDVVPRLPPRTMGPFRHFGQEYSEVQGRWTLRSRSLAQAYTLASSVPLGGIGWLAQQLPQTRWIELPFSIEDHGALHYINVSNSSVQDSSYC